MVETLIDPTQSRGWGQVIVPLRDSSAPRSMKEKSDREIAKCVSVLGMVGLFFQLETNTP